MARALARPTNHVWATILCQWHNWLSEHLQWGSPNLLSKCYQISWDLLLHLQRTLQIHSWKHQISNQSHTPLSKATVYQSWMCDPPPVSRSSSQTTVCHELESEWERMTSNSDQVSISTVADQIKILSWLTLKMTSSKPIADALYAGLAIYNIREKGIVNNSHWSQWHKLG